MMLPKYVLNRAHLGKGLAFRVVLEAALKGGVIVRSPQMSANTHVCRAEMSSCCAGRGEHSRDVQRCGGVPVPDIPGETSRGRRAQARRIGSSVKGVLILLQ